SEHFGLTDFFEGTDFGGWRVTLEKYTGNAGYIDIYLKHHATGKVILIENKIFAGDQWDQLIRYYNYAQSTAKINDGIRLVYLTNDGKDPHPDSMSKESLDKLMDLAKQKIYLKRSHAEHTRRWISECLDQIVADRLKIPLEHY